MTEANRCLWLAREVPFPLDSGDKIYSAHLSQALARSGVDVTMLAHRAAGDPQPMPGWPVKLTVIEGGKIPQWRALLSPRPMYSSVHPTHAYRAALDEALRRPWDTIIIDQLGSEWAMPAVLAYRRGRPQVRLVHISHNHETTLWRGMTRQSHTWPLRRLALWQNAVKVERAEKRLVDNVDLLTAVTAEDVELYRAQAPHTARLLITPAYSGVTREELPVTPQTPRRVVLVGSFRWAVKQENLRQFLAIADPVFARESIALDVVGDVPKKLRDELTPGLRATTLHGFVDDIEPIYRNARMAVVPEAIGGGFKLKFLDYFFARLAIASLAGAAAGLNDELRAAMLLSNDLQALTASICANIDDCERLNGLHREAYTQARNLYRWDDRGIALRDAIAALPRR